MIIKKYEYKSIFENKIIISFDTEAFRYGNVENEKYTEYQELANYSIYDGKNYYHGITKNEFIRHVKVLLDKYKNIILVAHNIKYDLSNLDLIEFIISGEKLLNLEQKKGLIGEVNYIKYANKDLSIEFLDSFNYFKTSLEKIALGIGLEKYATKENYNLPYTEWNNFIEKNGMELCDKDCYILYQLINGMVENKIIKWGVSMASSSFRTYLTSFIPHSINLEDFNEIALLGYHGGRTEVYNTNYQDFTIDLDINSLYPYSMLKHKYSIQLRRKINKNDLNINYLKANIINENYNYLINVDYKILDDNLIRIPIMSSVNGKLIQLKENNNQWITGREFYYLITNNKCEYKINECYEFYNYDLFSNFVKYFYKLKDTDNKLYHMFYKGVMNSLYGKFGQHKGHSEFIHFDNIKDDDFKNIILSHKERTRILYNGINYSIYNNYISTTTKEQPIYSVLTAMEVTANARLYNFDMQKYLGFENVLYTDTDSFFTTLSKDDDKVKAILNEHEIGKMKIEKSGNFQGFAPKHYKINDDLTLKGIPKKALKISENVYEYDTIRYIKIKSEKKIIVMKIKKVVKDKNDKMNYIKGIGYVWENKEQYLEYDKNYIKAVINDKNK